MKITLFIFFSGLFFASPGRSQADIRAMLKQIALIAVHVRELEKAIEIARDGLTTIHDIKNGEFHLHQLFFSSLQSVNPAVARYSKIAEIISDQISIITGFQNILRRLRTDKTLPVSELTYVNAVYTHLTDECSESLSNLIAITTDGPFEMTDDERIERIDGIYADIKDKYAFTQAFTMSTNSLVSETTNDEHETSYLKMLE
jgi:hypothetical protein